MNINIKNYEEWMVNYLEGNLNSYQVKELTRFLEQHPELKPELDAFEQTKLQPDMHVVFAGKNALKKKEPKIVAMRPYYKYAMAIAAMLILFTGIKFLTNNTADTNGKQYAAHTSQRPAFAFDRKTEQEKKQMQNSNMKTSEQRYFAQEKEKQNNKIENIKKENNNNRQNKIDIYRQTPATENIELTTTSALYSNGIKGHLKSAGNDKQFAYLNQYNYTQMMEPVQQNSDNSIIDKWNNALAFAGQMSGILGFDKKEDAAGTPAYKTTSVKIFDLQYYNRKKVNN